MLKMKEVSEYCKSMDEVADDFIVHISCIRNQQGEVIGIEKECFKWAMECETFFNMNNIYVKKKKYSLTYYIT